jgi:uncharacterized protein
MHVVLPDGLDLGADPVAEVLKRHHTIGIVGLSSDPGRPSYGVAQYMRSVGYRIIPVNPNETEVLGEKSYPRLDDVPEKIEIVNIFRRPEEVSPAVEGAIRIGAKVVWMQLGIEHRMAAERARTAGLIVVMDACIFVEHKRRLPSLSR